MNGVKNPSRLLYLKKLKRVKDGAQIYLRLVIRNQQAGRVNSRQVMVRLYLHILARKYLLDRESQARVIPGSRDWILWQSTASKDMG